MMAIRGSNKGSFARRRSLKGGVVKRSTSISTLRNRGIREIDPFKSQMRGA